MRHGEHGREGGEEEVGVGGASIRHVFVGVVTDTTVGTGSSARPPPGAARWQTLRQLNTTAYELTNHLVNRLEQTGRTPYAEYPGTSLPALVMLENLTSLLRETVSL